MGLLPVEARYGHHEPIAGRHRSLRKDLCNGGVHSSFFHQNMRCLFTANGFNGCEPESVEIQSGKEMLPFSQENRRHG